MDLENISLIEDRPGLTVTPEMEDSTGEYIGFKEEVSSGKDAYSYSDANFTQEELMDALGPDAYEAYLEDQNTEEFQPFSLEEVDQMLETADAPDPDLAQVAWSLDLPDDPAVDVVQVLASKYLSGGLSIDDAIEQAFQFGYTEDQLVRAYSIFNQAYSAKVNQE